MLNDLFLISSTTLALSCLFMTVLLWIFANNSRAKRMMAVSFSLLTLFECVFFIQTYRNSYEKVEKLDFIYSLFCICLVYSVYLYFRILMQPQSRNKPIIRSLVVISLSYIGLYILFSVVCEPVSIHSLKDIKTNSDNPMVWLRVVIFLHFLVAFVFAAISALKMYREHKKTIASQFSYEERISLSWLPYILFLFILNGIGTIFDIFLSGHDPALFIFSNFAYTAFYLICGFLVIKQQDILYNECTEASNGENEMRLQNIPLNVRVQLRNALKTLMEEDKIYRDSELRLDGVIRILRTNRTYLSLIIKEDFGDNFISFVNRYRIEEAKKLITDIDNTSGLYEIAEQVGFKSLSSFNVFFKRFTNQTPAKFRVSYFEQIQEP